MGVYALRRLGRKIRDDNLGADSGRSDIGGLILHSRHWANAREWPVAPNLDRKRPNACDLSYLT